jgi:hypothetical protein
MSLRDFVRNNAVLLAQNPSSFGGMNQPVFIAPRKHRFQCELAQFSTGFGVIL